MSHPWSCICFSCRLRRDVEEKRRKEEAVRREYAHETAKLLSKIDWLKVAGIKGCRK